MKKPKTEKLRLIPYPVILFLKMRERIRRFEDDLFEAILSLFIDPFGDDDDRF